MSKNSRSRKFRGGAYATVVSFLVIVVLIVVNLISGSLFDKIDMSSTGKYTIADETKEFAKSVSTPVDLYYVYQESEEDLTIKTAAELIADANNLITLTFKDPVQYPQFIYRYNDTSEINPNSIIVVNADAPERYSYIDVSDMMIYEVNTSAMTKAHVGYDAEVEIAKAIIEVTQDKKATIYATVNHNEWLTNIDKENLGSVTQTFSDLLKLNAYKLKYVNLTAAGGVPADCDILLIGGPRKDFTAEEVEAVKNYMTSGGIVITSTYVGADTLTNYQALLNYYGVRLGAGIVCESDSSLTVGDQPPYLLTKVGNESAAWPFTTPLYTDVLRRNTTTVETLYRSSAEGYVKLSEGDYTKLSTDETGEYPILMKIEDTYNGSTGTMYVFGASFFFSDVFMTGTSQMANRDMFIDMLNQHFSQDSNTVRAIPDTTALNEALRMTTSERNKVAIASFLLPALILCVGIVVILRRRVERIQTSENTVNEE